MGGHGFYCYSGSFLGKAGGASLVQGLWQLATVKNSGGGC